MGTRFGKTLQPRGFVRSVSAFTFANRCPMVILDEADCIREMGVCVHFQHLFLIRVENIGMKQTEKRMEAGAGVRYGRVGVGPMLTRTRWFMLMLAGVFGGIAGCGKDQAASSCGPDIPCTAGQACVVGVCTGPCTTELDCPAGALCEDGLCAKVCEHHSECTTEGQSYACVTGLCEAVAAPGWIKITGPSAVDELQTITLSAADSYVVDPDGSKIVWRQVDVGDLPPLDGPILPDAGPDGAVVGPTVSVRAPKLVQDIAVSVSATLIGTDGKQLSTAVIILLRNTENEPPIAFAAAEPTIVRPGSVVALDAERSYDPNPADSLTYQWSYLPTTVSLEILDGSGDGSFRQATVVAPVAKNDVGVRFMVEVSDGKDAGFASVEVLFLGTGAGCDPGAVGGCNDGNPCTEDRCLVTGDCDHVPMAGGCDDGNPCTTGDECDGGVCRGTGLLVCDDGNRCTQDSCDVVQGCISIPAAGACDDGNQCTQGDRCLDGECEAGDNICPCSLNVDCVAFDDGNLCNGALVCDSVSGGCVLSAKSVVVCQVNEALGQCTVSLCNPNNGLCELLPAAAGSPCDDGNACTSQDFCVGGGCVGIAPADCDDNNVCTDDLCDPAVGCQYKQNDKLCDDGNVCTTDDRCSPQGCKGQVKSPCDDGNPCTDDTCSPVAGCVHQPNAAACDDGNLCTIEDSCDGGVCVGGSKLTCDDSNPCTVDLCDAVIGCKHMDVTGPCNDGDLCTAGDYCAGGNCQPGFGLVCDDNNVCTDEICDPELGCVVSPGNTKACEDGNPCTVFDTCNSGMCVSGTNECHCTNNGGCLAYSSPCLGQMKCVSGLCQPVFGTAVNCSGKKPVACYQWVCDDDQGDCVLDALPQNVACDDGDACTNGDLCKEKGCIGAVVKCDDGNPCTADGCNPQKGCVFTAVSGPCEDGSVCTKNDGCVDGVCVGGAPTLCDDGNKCTTDSCVPASGCVSVTNTLPCSDGDPCTIADQCKGGGCVGGAKIQCGDGNPCTADSCVAGVGCMFVAVGGGCDDGNACTTGDICQDGVCVGGPPPQCPAGVCYTTLCSQSSGCVSVWGSWACDDGDLCTVGDKCDQGKCVPGVPVTCDDNNPCTADDCDAVAGCVSTFLEGPCDDSVACTKNESCVNGVCVPKEVDCGCNDDADCPDDANLCNGVPFCDPNSKTCIPKEGTTVVCPGFGGDDCLQEECDPKTGNCIQIPAVSGVLCDDGNVCTQGDFCGVGGVCLGGPSMYCNDGNPCTADLCEPGAGCFFAKLTGTLCGDGDACTTGDLCFLGECVAAAQADCDDANPCTVDSCVAGTGCVHLSLPGACSDGNACTINDFCVLGVCLSGAPQSCDDGNACTVDTCVGASGCVHTASTGKCDDGDACTVGDFCLDKMCWKGATVVCNDDNPCTNDGCATAVGCTYLPNTVPCDDGNPCTGGGQCQGGICLVGKPLNCDDNNPCTTDGCSVATGCVSAPNNAPCDDNNPCTFGDVCGSGQCTPGLDACLNCKSNADCEALDDANPCNGVLVCSVDGPVPTCEIAPGSVVDCGDAMGGCMESVCDPLTGGCVVQAVNDGMTCDDGDACTLAEHCVDGECVVTSPFGCFAKSTPGCVGCDCESCVCGSDSFCCEVAWDGVCAASCVEDCGQLCDSGAQGDLGCVTTAIAGCGGCECETCVCEQDPYCCITAWDLTCVQACTVECGQHCVDPVTVQCDDSNPCTLDLCDKLTGCLHTNLPDGAFCDDGNECSNKDGCVAGKCSGSLIGACDDNNPCTNDKCVAGTCLNEPNTLACDDGNTCTADDVCNQGWCKPGAPLSCSTSEPCLTPTCDATLGCVLLPAPVGSACLNQQNLCGGQGACKKWDVMSFVPELGVPAGQRFALLSVAATSGALTAVGAAWDPNAASWGGAGYIVELTPGKSAKVVYKHPGAALMAIDGTIAVGQAGTLVRHFGGKWGTDTAAQDALGLDAPLVSVWTGLVGSPAAPTTLALVGVGDAAGGVPVWSCLLTGDAPECATDWTQSSQPVVGGLAATTESKAALGQESLFLDRAWFFSNYGVGETGAASPAIWALVDGDQWTTDAPGGCAEGQGFCAKITAFRDIVALSKKEAWTATASGILGRFDGVNWQGIVVGGLADGVAVADVDLKALAKVGKDVWLAAEIPGCGAGQCVGDSKSKSHVLLHLDVDKNTWFPQRILKVRTCPVELVGISCSQWLSRFVITDMAIVPSGSMAIVGADVVDSDPLAQVMSAYLVELK